MLIDALLKAADILRLQPGHTMPLARLHTQLRDELGSVGSYADLYRQLKKQPTSFALVDTARILGGTDGWSGLVRERYDSALDGAGLGSCIRVTLTELPETERSAEILAALTETVGALSGELENDRALQEYARRAVHELAELSRVMSAAADHPTIPPPDLRRAE